MFGNEASCAVPAVRESQSTPFILTNYRRRIIRSSGGSMNKVIICILAFVAIVATIVFICCQYKGEAEPKNVILMISDGAGFNHFHAQGYYAEGKALPEVLEAFPTKLAVATCTLDSEYDPQKAWADSVWIADKFTDSAAAATAMACGEKTYKGILGMDTEKNPLSNVTELAKKNGRKAGVVTTVMFSHATPAGFVAHQPSRSYYTEIAHQMIASQVDVIIGCGYPTGGKCKYVGGEAVWQALQQGATAFDHDSDGQIDFYAGDCNGDGTPDPWFLISDVAEFENSVDTDNTKRILGIPKCYHTLQQERKGDRTAMPYEVPFQDSLPNLVLLSKVALDNLSDDPDGFFLMIEGGAVDWAAHHSQTGRLIEEQQDFIDAVETVVNWIESHGGWDENLLVITADHECGYLTGPGSLENMSENVPVPQSGAGQVPELRWHGRKHTNSLVPLFSKGNGSQKFQQSVKGSDPVYGDYIDNTDIGKFLHEWAGGK